MMKKQLVNTKISLSLLTFCVITSLLAFFVINGSVAWFSTNRETNAMGMQVVMDSEAGGTIPATIAYHKAIGKETNVEGKTIFCFDPEAISFPAGENPDPVDLAQFNTVSLMDNEQTFLLLHVDFGHVGNVEITNNNLKMTAITSSTQFSQQIHSSTSSEISNREYNRFSSIVAFYFYLDDELTTSTFTYDNGVTVDGAYKLMVNENKYNFATVDIDGEGKEIVNWNSEITFKATNSIEVRFSAHDIYLLVTYDELLVSRLYSENIGNPYLEEQFTGHKPVYYHNDFYFNLTNV